MTTTRPQLPVMSFLTRRELDVASALGAGMSYAETAAHLGIRADTARQMTKAIAAKLGPQLQHPGGPRETVLRWLIAAWLIGLACYGKLIARDYEK